MKRRTPHLITILVLMASQLTLNAQQEPGSHPYEHHHKHNEFAAGTGAVYFPEESSWGYSLHFHALLGLTEWMGVGPGYELILGEYTHHTVAGLLHFHPFHPLDINIGPGLVFPNDEVREYRFKLHMEIAAVFEVSEHLHLGPSLDAGIGKSDPHVALGIHIGYAF